MAEKVNRMLVPHPIQYPISTPKLNIEIYRHKMAQATA
ncbi:hypothetical protein BD65_1272 [Yersinia ruckeri]|nr:hypothetical protein BD65_1272 [Yersinia ruckeri]